MKKIIILTALLAFAFSGSASAALITAAGGCTAGAAKIIKGGPAGTTFANVTNPMGKMSTGVYVCAAYDTTQYALITKHITGSKKVGTANDSTAIYFVQEAAGALTAFPTAKNQTAFSTGWSSM